jgi:hypothetical protein
MKRRQIAVMALLLCGALGFGWLDGALQQSHLPKHNQTAQQPKKETTSNGNKSSIWKPNDPISLYTLVLALFSGILVAVSVVQICYLGRADETSRIAAKAAEKSANAIAITERPYIFIWGIRGYAPTATFTSSDNPNIKVIENPNASFIYSISNRGKLTAVIENVSIACGYERKGNYPPLKRIGNHFLLQVPLISSEKDIDNISIDIPWQELDTSNPVPEFRNGLIFHVVVSYRGPFTRGHETSQCWRYLSSVNGFAEDGLRTYAR